jgi:TctA family transporter
VFFTRSISAGFLIATALLLAFLILPTIRKKREEATAEPDAV